MKSKCSICDKEYKSDHSNNVIFVNFHLTRKVIQHLREAFKKKNKLKSLKFTQVKDEMDVDEDDGCVGVCDVKW